MSPDDDDDDDDDDDENSDVVGNQYLADMWKLDVDHGRQRWLYVQEQAGELNRTLEEHLLTKRSVWIDLLLLCVQKMSPTLREKKQ